MKKVALLVISIVLILCHSSYAGGIDDVLNSAKREGKLVMLEVGSEDCVPCEKMKPVIEKLKTNYKGKLEVIFVDFQKDRDISWRFGVVVIPTQVFLDKNGREFNRHNGFYDYWDIFDVMKTQGLDPADVKAR